MSTVVTFLPAALAVIFSAHAASGWYAKQAGSAPSDREEQR